LSKLSKDYIEVAQNVSTIFDALELLYVIEPLYYTNWSFIKHLISIEMTDASMSKEKGILSIFVLNLKLIY
jgi:hypothetical protein